MYIGLINSHMIDIKAEVGEHVNWGEPDFFNSVVFEELTNQPLEEYAEENPHMIIWEVI